jgi:uncharacterized protein (DUF58 family)
MIRPTRRAVLLFAASVPLALVIAAAAPSWWALSVDGAVLVLAGLASDALLALRPRALGAEFTIPERIYIGDTGEIVAKFKATRLARPTRIELLAEQQGDLEPAAIRSVELESGQGAVLELPLIPRRRGRIAIDRVWMRWQGPFGLVQIIHRAAIGRRIDVVQNVRGVQRAALQFFAQEAVFGVRVQQERGDGTEFDALREYVPGLDTRVIDWKHSARHHKLVCKEFRVERNHPIVLAFDTGHLMAEPIDGVPRLDHAINAGLLLAWIALKGGDLVGNYGFDATVRHYVQPVRGMANFPRLLRSTAELAYHHEETNFTLGLAELATRLKRRALVVLFTDFVDTVTAELLVESMQRVAQKHVVIFVSLRDPFLQATVDAAPDRFETVAEAVIADDFLRDRRVVFDRLERLGIHCLDVPREGLSIGLINRYLMIKQRGLL